MNSVIPASHYLETLSSGNICLHYSKQITVQKMKFSIEGFFSKSDQICNGLLNRKQFTHFSPEAHFCTPWKRQKTFGFPIAWFRNSYFCYYWGFLQIINKDQVLYFFQINNHVLAGFRKAPDTHRVNTFDVKPLQTSKRGKEWSLMR